MVNFNLEKAKIYRAVFWQKSFFLRNAEILSFFFLLFSTLILCFLAFSKFFFEVGFFEQILIALVLFFAVLFLLFYEIDLFFHKCLQNPFLLIDKETALRNIKKINLAEFLNYESALIIEKANEKSFVDSYLLLLSLLKNAQEMEFVFYRALIDKNLLIRDLSLLFKENEKRKGENHYSQCFLQTIKDAFILATKRGSKRITPEDIFVSLVSNNRYLQEVFYRKGLNKEDLFDLISWQIKIKEKKNPFLYKNLIKKGSIKKEWSGGYTPFLDMFCSDWQEEIKITGFPETIGHKKEIKSLERVLSRNEINCPLLTGEAGSGRKSIIRQVAKNSFLGESMPEINHKRFLEIDLSALVSSANKKEIEETLSRVFDEALRAGNVVLIIDQFHNFVGEKERAGIVDISGVLSSYLKIPSFRIIGITDYEKFHQNIESRPYLLSLMEKIEVNETKERDTLLLLQREALFWERKYGKIISFAALKKIVFLCKRYIQNHPFPEKATDLLEESMIYLNQEKSDVLLPELVEKIVTEKTEVPVGDIEKKEKKILLNMENLLHKIVVNQNKAIKAVSLALRRKRADIDTRKGLIGSFLFLGPTGVGKTETAKAVARVYFGKKKKINRLDMSEFQNLSDISRLIGSSSEEGILTGGVREDPFSLIMLDEIEKAHPGILHLFLQVLDEGHLTDGKGRKVSFENCMVVATSNAGYQIIINAVKEKKNWEKTKEDVLNDLFSRFVFRPEFVNRFDEVVLFTPLNYDNLLSIAEIQLGKLVRKMKDKEIQFIVTEDLKKKIADMSYDPLFGAREMQRVIQNNIGETLSLAILKEEIKKGDSFIINAEDFSLQKQS